MSTGLPRPSAAPGWRHKLKSFFLASPKNRPFTAIQSPRRDPPRFEAARLWRPGNVAVRHCPLIGHCRTATFPGLIPFLPIEIGHFVLRNMDPFSYPKMNIV